MMTNVDGHSTVRSMKSIITRTAKECSISPHDDKDIRKSPTYKMDFN